MNKIISLFNFKAILWVVFILVLNHQGFSQTSETGMASFYNDKFEGKPTASGYHGWGKSKLQHTTSFLQMNFHQNQTCLLQGLITIASK